MTTETFTDRLRQMGWDAEDAGSEVEYEWHDEYEVLRSIVIDGVEHENPNYKDEVDDFYWVFDSYRAAERDWRS